MVDSETLKTQESSHIQDVSLEIPFNLSFTCFSRVGAKCRECECVANVTEYLRHDYIQPNEQGTDSE